MTVDTTVANTTTVCPFCSSVNLTFTDQIAAKDVVVSATLLEIPEYPDDPDAELPRATFEISQVLKGGEYLNPGMQFKALLVGRYKKGKEFLVMGIDPPDIAWTTPIKAPPTLLKYLADIQTIPADGPERLVFFQDYLEHEVSAIAFDAYDEFAKAPYEDLIGMKDRMRRPQLLQWILSKDTSINRRRLYFTMLGVCGTQQDADVLEKLIAEGSESDLRGIDALVACYLCLKGDAGIDLIEQKFLVNSQCDFTTTMGAVTALRFHGTEVEIVSKQRIIKAVRKLLDRPRMADIIISDLARWGDWEATDKLVAMFKESKKENRWLRVPIVGFLMASPEQKAKDYLAELKKIDPQSIKRAMLYGGGFDDEDDDDSDLEDMDSDRQETDSSQSSSQADKALGEMGLNHSVESTSQAAPDPFAEFDQARSAISETSDAQTDLRVVEQRYTTYKVPVESSESQPVSSTDLPGGSQGEVDPVANRASNIQTRAESLAVATGVADTSIASVASPPVAAVPYLTLKIILIPFACSVALFFLLWSVFNGSFERLIY